MSASDSAGSPKAEKVQLFKIFKKVEHCPVC
jgi:hypothetical protein